MSISVMQAIIISLMSAEDIIHCALEVVRIITQSKSRHILLIISVRPVMDNLGGMLFFLSSL